MREMRRDPLTGRWVFVDTAAPKAEGDYLLDEPHLKGAGNCPFCPGNESGTPPETAVWGRAAGGTRSDWKVRVVPNIFPVVHPGPFEKGREDLYERMSAFGIHEVVIEHPDHHREMADYSEDEMRLVLRAYGERYRAIAKDRRVRSILIFKNYGAKAGASLEHPHTQLIALPVVPHEIEDEVRMAEEHCRRTGRCLYCEMLEVSEPPLEIFRNGHFAALAPFASRFPFEVLVLPLNHESRFPELVAEEREDFGEMLRRVLGRLKDALRDPPFNFFIHCPPLGEETRGFHWHLEVVPKVMPLSAFEWGSGCYFNPTPPELAASILRGK